MSGIFPKQAWDEVDAQQRGWRRDLLSRAEQSAMEFGTISGFIIHKGTVIASHGDPQRKILIRSMRKSFLSALIGIEVERGRIRLDDTLAELGIDDVNGLTASEQQATVRQLLQARSGIYHPALAESKEMLATKPPRGSSQPGDRWYYNNWDFNALGTIYETATGQSVFDGVYRDIALPIGMQDFQPSDGEYLRGDASIHPAYHMLMTSRDLARFGWLYLNRGRWHDAQVVPETWVHESVAAHSFDGTNGYGYMWWTTGHDGEAQNTAPSPYRKHMPPFRYFAHGHHGQMIAVMPEKEIVIVHLAQSIERSREQNEKLWAFVSLVLEAQPPAP
ncbi:class C beta-lactamase-related serine hydrolase [Neorhizobium sp. P12A]|uniref:serine hydrolase domain-containing protein n=1 Tax=Neorhizobium sp. P12A TaxID=2268027 RepID=UPI0011F07127|nr:serine hydrolase [Neorhizobium sp. P12A]KAA0694498.1 class C beta-lactamase-related serine hydrolase [Neorhizobium sp. P12A]